MEKREQLNALLTRQLELQAVMQSSDNHCIKCAKLGLTYADEYPEECEAYEAARNEFNQNEANISLLEAEIEAELEMIQAEEYI